MPDDGPPPHPTGPGPAPEVPRRPDRASTAMKMQDALDRTVAAARAKLARPRAAGATRSQTQIRSLESGPARLGAQRKLVVMGAVVVAIMGAAALISIATGPKDEPCLSPAACGGPQPGFAPLAIAGQTWTDPTGVSASYSTTAWQRTDGEHLLFGDADLELSQSYADDTWTVLTVATAPGSTAQELRDRIIAELRDRMPDLEEDSSLGHRIFGPNVGYADGIGASYLGHLNDKAVVVAVMASERQGLAVALVVVAGTKGTEDDRDFFMRRADSIGNTVRWP